MTERRNPIQDRAFRAESEDGVVELLMALFLLIPALTVAEPAFAWMVAIPILTARRITHRIRSRLTYPRIGFVEAERDSSRELFGGMARWTLLVFVIVGILLLTTHRISETAAWRQYAPLLAALLCCGGFTYALQRTGLKRYVFFTVVALVLGTFLTWLPVAGGSHRVQQFLAGMSAVAFVSSLILMWLFARKYPVLEVDDGE